MAVGRRRIERGTRVNNARAVFRRRPRVAGAVRARGGQENRVAVPVRPERSAGSADANVQRSAVPAPVERQRLPAVFAELRHRAADARGELHTRGDRGQHGHRAEQHVPAAGAHGPQAVQHDRLPRGMADVRMVQGNRTKSVVSAHDRGVQLGANRRTVIGGGCDTPPPHSAILDRRILELVINNYL